MIYVALNNISIIANHGLFPEEHILANEFVVNIKVGSKNEDNFIDYSELLEIVNNCFTVRKDYLESLIKCIEKEIMTKLKTCHYLYISIKKKNPPLKAIVESSEVVLEKTYSNSYNSYNK